MGKGEVFMNYCPNCGEKVVGRFCHNCGADLEKIANSASQVEPKKTKKSSTKAQEVVATQVVEEPVAETVIKVKKVERAKYTEKQVKLFKILPACLFFGFAVLSMLFFLMPVATVFGESLGSLYDFVSEGTAYVLQLIISVVSIVLGGFALIYLNKDKTYKYPIIDIASQVIVFVQFILSIVIMASVSDVFTDVGACPIMMLIFSLLVLGVNITFIVLEKLGTKNGRIEKREKPLLVFEEAEPVKPEVVERPRVKEIHLDRLMKFMKYVGKAILAVGLAFVVYDLLMSFVGLGIDNAMREVPPWEIEDKVNIIRLVAIGLSLLIFAGLAYSYIKGIVFKPSTPTYRSVARKGSLYVLFFFLAYCSAAWIIANVSSYKDVKINAYGVFIIIFFVLSFVLAVINSILKKKLKKTFYNKEREQILTIEEFDEMVKKEKEEYSTKRREYLDYKANLKNFNEQTYLRKLASKNSEKWQVGKAYSSAGLWLRKHTGLLIGLTAIVVAVIIGVSAIISYANNIFRIGRIEQVELGMTKTEIEDVLEEAHFGNDYMFGYYTDDYKSVLDEINELSTNIEAMLDPSTIERLAELAEKLEKLEYSMISISMDENGEMIDLLYIVNAKATQENPEKVVEKVEVFDKDAAGSLFQIGYYKTNGIPVRVYYTDGSYHIHVIPYAYANVTEDGYSMIDGITTYHYEISWSDTFADIEDIRLECKG